MAENGEASGESTSLPVLGYWNVRGFAQATRFLFHYLNVDFEDRLHGFSPAPNYKQEWREEIRPTLNLDFPNVPYLLDGDVRMTESRAILRQVARKYGPHLLPEAGKEWRADMLEYFLTDVLAIFTRLLYHYTEELHASFKVEQPVRLKQLSDFLGSNDWCLGDSLTYLDFYLYEILYQHTVFQPDCFDDLPRLQAHLQRFEALPEISKYMTSPQFLKAPCYSPVAKYRI